MLTLCRTCDRPISAAWRRAALDCPATSDCPRAFDSAARARGGDLNAELRALPPPQAEDGPSASAAVRGRTELELLVEKSLRVANIDRFFFDASKQRNVTNPDISTIDKIRRELNKITQLYLSIVEMDALSQVKPPQRSMIQPRTINTRNWYRQLLLDMVFYTTPTVKRIGTNQFVASHVINSKHLIHAYYFRSTPPRYVYFMHLFMQDTVHTMSGMPVSLPWQPHGIVYSIGLHHNINTWSHCINNKYLGGARRRLIAQKYRRELASTTDTLARNRHGGAPTPSCHTRNASVIKLPSAPRRKPEELIVGPSETLISPRMIAGGGMYLLDSTTRPTDMSARKAFDKSNLIDFESKRRENRPPSNRRAGASTGSRRASPQHVIDFAKRAEAVDKQLSSDPLLRAFYGWDAPKKDDG